jgi:hypothetical protein
LRDRGEAALHESRGTREAVAERRLLGGPTMRTERLSVAAMFASLALAACGASTGLAQSPDADAGPGLDADASEVADALPEVADVASDVAAETSPACQAIVDAISARSSAKIGSCTTVVRVDAGSRAILGYSMFCGPYGATTEAAARDRAKLETGVGSCFAPPSITGANPADDFVFYQAATAAACACCGDGWVTAVSARNGQTVLGAKILFGEGDGLAFPATWSPPSELGLDCASNVHQPPARGFDVTGLGAIGGTPAALDAPTLSAALDAVWRTALPAGLWKNGYVFDAVVLRYGAQAVSPAHVEWLVLLNSGWLE